MEFHSGLRQHFSPYTIHIKLPPLCVSFHRREGHTLVLSNGTSTCDSCLKDFKDSPFYTCTYCKFKMDIECEKMTWSSPASEKFLQHLSHPHSLSQIFVERKAVKCVACESMFSGSGYGCTHCDYFLDKWCAEFPMETSQHLLHPLHGHNLSLVVNPWIFNCQMCETKKQSRVNFRLECNRCEFKLCWKCHVNVKRSITCEDHNHELFFVERNFDGRDNIDLCDGYDAYCSRSDLIEDANILKEFKRGNMSSMLKCLDCKFKLHLLCGPLPSTVKHECHIHPLTLHHSLTEDDYGEYYCDVCETERDPRIRVYHCQECKYFAHVDCVVSKILSVLRGELEGINLKALGKETWSDINCMEVESTMLTLKDLIDKLNVKESDFLKYFYKWDNTAISKDKKISLRRCLSDKEIHDTLRLSRFTREEFTHFYNKLKDHAISIRPLELKPSDLGLKLVKVKGYFIPSSLANVLKMLLQNDKYLIYDTYESKEMIGIQVFLLCQVVKRMSETMVKDITKELLQEWFYHLRFLNIRKFTPKIALRQFENLVDAFLGFQTQRLISEIPKELKRKIAKLERDLEKCIEYTGLSEKSEYMKYCLNKASELKWKDGLACLPKQDSHTRLSARREWINWF